MASKTFEVGELVAFKTVAFGVILGRVVERNRYVPLLGERVKVRITSRKSKGYPLGLCYEFTPGAIWSRAVKAS